MQKPSPRPEPGCAEPVKEPPFQWLIEKLKHSLPWVTRPSRHYERPVAWLLGRQMMGSLKGTLLYTAFGSKLDPRDWMQARPFPPCAAKEVEEVETYWRNLVSRREGLEGATSAKPFWEQGGAFWFDYLSDTGDGMKATYSLAYLCMSELHVKGTEVRGPSLDIGRWPKGEYETLPRGEFLFIGGDTAYHLSDYMTLIKRFQNPFTWAFEDLEGKGLVVDEPAAHRPIFGIPGNHDYYDQLDGFRRQFREPTESRTEDKQYPRDDSERAPQLRLPGFRREQESSYVALRLPFGWWLWGLDTEVGRVDERQRDFFMSLCKDPKKPAQLTMPDKLIVATSAPTTVFGKIADRSDEKSTRAFEQIRVAQPFLPYDEPVDSKTMDPEKPDAARPDFAKSGDAKLKAGQCRLDLSGDVHHYARYWGPPHPDAPEPRPEDTHVEAPTSESYASVVSGIGGAFHHPSETFAGEVREQVLYPPEKCSREEVARRIFNFWMIFTGGYVSLAGFLMAFVIFFAASVPQSSRQFFNNLCLRGYCPLRSLGLETRSEPIRPTVSPLTTAFEKDEDRRKLGLPLGDVLAQRASEPVRPVARAVASRFFSVSPEWRPSPPCAPDQPSYLFGPCRSPMPWDVRIGLLLLLGSLVAIGLTAYHREKLFGKDEPGRPVREIKFNPHTVTWLWLIVAATSVMAFGGLILVAPYQGHITPFNNSLLVLFSIIWAVGATALSFRYGEWLFVKSQKYELQEHDWWLKTVLHVLSVISVAFGLWSFGRNNLPALLVSDILFFLTLVGAVSLLIALAFKVGGDKKGPAGKYRWWPLLFVGIWHALLQVAVPFLLIRKGSLLTLLVAAALVFLPIVLNFGGWVMNSRTRGARRAGLLAAWLLYGGLMLLLPFITWKILNPGAPFADFRNYQGLWMQGGDLARAWPTYGGWWETYGGWVGLVPSVAAGAVGAVVCCLFFGWYLAVSLSFHAHNNEVGGATRIERFKEFIRFRVTEDDITGYVIAVDDPLKKGGELRPKVVDVFRLRVKSAP